MNYIIFDLEFNQDYPPVNKNQNSKAPMCPFEIIQIGAVKFDENLNTIGNFNKLVKPSIFKKMNPHVKELTNINIEQLNKANTFDYVYEDFLDFTEDKNNVFCVWGTSDIKELYRNINYHHLSILGLPNKYINIQPYTSKLLNASREHMISLKHAIELLSIPYDKNLHDAFNDAYYTAEIFKSLYRDDIEPEEYFPAEKKSYSRSKLQQKKKKTDVFKLINQFEKMYEREMSQEEKSIIKLAYVMGKTHQFEE